MLSIGSILPLLVIAICAALLAYVALARAQIAGRLWLALTLLATIVAAAMLLLPADIIIAGRFGRGFAVTLALAALLIAFGGMLLRDTYGAAPRPWWFGGLVWWLLVMWAALASPSFSIGERDWLTRLLSAPDVAGLLALGGFLAAGTLLPGLALAAYLRASLPEIGNRAMLWVFQAVAVLCGCALMLSGVGLLMQAGVLALLLGTAGATYMHTQHQAFDLPGRLRFATQLLATIVLTALLITGALWLAVRLGLHTGTLPVIGVFGLIMAMIYVPLRQGVEWALGRYARSRSSDPTAAARRYSQQITRSLDLRQLAQTVVDALIDVMDARRAGLMLVNAPDPETGLVAVRFLPGQGDGARELRARLPASSPIYRRWQDERAPLTQYDIEYNPHFSSANAAERAFFHEIGMSAYAPILVDEMLIGVLVCGTKRDETLYAQHDLDLLATMADQTGIALRNARLVADLRQLNDSAQILNRGLNAAKEQMEKLDGVKTDFITIASHELRTPLAQIKGYIDVADALNNQGILDQDRLSEHLENMRKAGDRIEELISAMLDVSQLDLKSMDLRFAESSLESILRMSVEPLVDVARQRKLSLVVRGLRGLPLIEADMTRLVQAFRNVLVNAIKFTPDGGRIDVGAVVKQEDGDERVVVSIADTGVGIDKENLELIFNKFYRAADPSLHSTGTYKFMGAGPGLGLTIARGIVEGHGGRIWVDSPGHDMEACPGSTFYIELPLHPPKDARRVMTFGDAGGEYGSDAIDATLVRQREPGR